MDSKKSDDPGARPIVPWVRKRVGTAVVAALSGAVVALAVFFSLGHSEPAYQGKPLRFWLDRISPSNPVKANADALVAIKSMGDKGYSALVEILGSRNR